MTRKTHEAGKSYSCEDCKIKGGGSSFRRVNCPKYNPMNKYLDCLNYKKK